jgi:uncharacterized repeat protein (TIGR03837 family)
VIIALAAASDNPGAMITAAPRWDVFCRVVDNFGDAGVCWRLARALAHTHGIDVTLWIDRVDALARIVDGIDANAADQRVDGVRVGLFAHAADASPARAIIEGFGCGLPDRYLDAMERKPPVWVNLEYLSAESWVDGAHGLPSPQPQRPLTRWFFFPGFTPATGGLLREPDLFERRANFPDPPHDTALDVSLFCYPNRGLPALLDTWASGDAPIRLRVADGIAAEAFACWSGHALPPAPARIARGALDVDVLPFVAQPAYDRRLWHCDLNFVRGEDSFVRAQWACKPMVWHIYPQAQDAHRAKLDAFLDRYLDGAGEAEAAAMRSFWHAFDRGDGDALALAWGAFRDALPALNAHAPRWSRRLASLPELSAELVRFVKMHYN